MVEYTKVNFRLSDSQLKKLKDAVSNNTGTTSKISLKMFNGNNLPHELLLTTRKELLEQLKMRQKNKKEDF